MKDKIMIVFFVLVSMNYTFAQFESANVTAYFTDEFQSVEIDSATTMTARKVEIKVENLDSLVVHGCNVEVLEANSDYIMRRKIGNKYNDGTMDFVSYENGSYILDMGFFEENQELKVYVRLEDYHKSLSDLKIITLSPYED